MLPASQPLTVAVPLDEHQVEPLRKLLGAINAGIAQGEAPVPLPGDAPDRLLQLDEMPHTHFTRFVVLDDRIRDAEGNLVLRPPADRQPPVLLWEVNHDGTLVEYLAALIADPDRRVGLDAIFSHARGWKGTELTAFHDFCVRHRVRAEAFYTGYRGEPRVRTVNDRKVREAIRRYVDERVDELNALPPVEARRLIYEHLRDEHPDLDLTRTEDPTPIYRARWAVTVGASIVLSPLLLATFGPLGLATRLHEKFFDHDEPWRADRPVHHQRHDQNEDKILQNQLTHVVDIKPGWFRFWLLRIVFLVIEGQARTKYNEGHLGDVRSIHFARWVILRDKRPGVRRRDRRHRLVFFSNYDFSWESYLGEFIDRASGGLTGVWSNTRGFPKTKWLIFDGAEDEEAFKQWARSCQRDSELWWSGYPDSTVSNVRDDLFVRRYLTGPAPDGGLQEWFRRL